MASLAALLRIERFWTGAKRFYQKLLCFTEEKSVPIDYKLRNLFILSCLLLHNEHPLASIAERNHGSLCTHNYYYF